MVASAWHPTGESIAVALYLRVGKKGEGGVGIIAHRNVVCGVVVSSAVKVIGYGVVHSLPNGVEGVSTGCCVISTKRAFGADNYASGTFARIKRVKIAC